MRIFLTAVIVLVALGLSTGSASADKKVKWNCDMTGEWEPKDDRTKGDDTFVFIVNYFVTKGADNFSGAYINPNNSARATITGAQTGNNWLIDMTYTDTKNKGLVRKAVGQGKFDGTAVSIKGTFTLDRKGDKKPPAKGAFSMKGKCHKV